MQHIFAACIRKLVHFVISGESERSVATQEEQR